MKLLPEHETETSITVNKADFFRLVEAYRRLKGLSEGQKQPVVLFHGVWLNASYGHSLYTRAGKTLDQDLRQRLSVPSFSKDLDGGYAPGTDELGRHPESTSMMPEQMVRTTHELGWTIFSFWDTTGDNRGGSNSAFIAEGIWEFEDLSKLIEDAFPFFVSRWRMLRKETPNAWRLFALGA